MLHSTVLHVHVVRLAQFALDCRRVDAFDDQVVRVQWRVQAKSPDVEPP